MNIDINGTTAGGLFTITAIPTGFDPVFISTFNSSLCAVIRVSPSQGTLQIYRPGITLNPFSTFESGKEYVILASTPFTITLTETAPPSILTINPAPQQSFGLSYPTT